MGNSQHISQKTYELFPFHEKIFENKDRKNRQTSILKLRRCRDYEGVRSESNGGTKLSEEKNRGSLIRAEWNSQHTDNMQVNIFTALSFHNTYYRKYPEYSNSDLSEERMCRPLAN